MFYFIILGVSTDVKCGSSEKDYGVLFTSGFNFTWGEKDIDRSVYIGVDHLSWMLMNLMPDWRQKIMPIQCSWSLRFWYCVNVTSSIFESVACYHNTGIHSLPLY
jgi:hypothetical protein